MEERGDPAREYARVRLTAVLLLGAAVPLSVVAAFLDLNPSASGAPLAYRWAFVAVAIVAAAATMSFHRILASGRPLSHPADAARRPRSVSARIAGLASVLLAIPFVVLLLGFALRVALGGTVLDYVGFLVIALVLWALFFPRRRDYEEWVRSRTRGQE